MKNYLKLVNFEFNRFFKVYAVLITITVVVQLSGVIFEGFSYVNFAQEVMQEEMITMNDYAMQYGPLSIYSFIKTGWFLIPIAIAAVTLLIYSLYIWYRDWYGKNTFIYRLLMLPVSRIKIFYAKVTTVFLCVLGLVALQYVLLYLENAILARIVPDSLFMFLPISSLLTYDFLVILYPATFFEFLLYYGAGLLFLFVLFTMILLERSYRLKGIFLAACYGAGAFILLLAPMIIHDGLGGYFFPLELFLIELFLALFIGIVSVLLSQFLLKNKVWV